MTFSRTPQQIINILFLGRYPAKVTECAPLMVCRRLPNDQSPPPQSRHRGYRIVSDVQGVFFPNGLLGRITEATGYLNSSSGLQDFPPPIPGKTVSTQVLTRRGCSMMILIV